MTENAIFPKFDLEKEEIGSANKNKYHIILNWEGHRTQTLVKQHSKMDKNKISGGPKVPKLVKSFKFPAGIQISTYRTVLKFLFHDKIPCNIIPVDYFLTNKHKLRLY